ncbi:uncharacterized protein LOC126987362 [Eriocheir sinensis]|uniref:uncharacterized protein LOC126987362 n=1 Tax=Eriocheir sinensis TaxID=95602 RepID=UPI0021C7ED01|nr:uncharacterized protein LOC126987362 [Eriocheir sinensis]
MKGRFSMINYESYVTLHINSNFTDSRGRSPFQLSRNSISIMAAYGWGLRKGAPFYNRFRQLTDRLRDSGLQKHWMQHVVEGYSRRKRATTNFTYDSSREYSKDSSVRVVLGLSHLDAAFYLLFLGNALALFTFLVEIITAC